MEINRKLFLTVLSQIKAHNDIIIVRDSPAEDKSIDILYQLRALKPPLILNGIIKITIPVSGCSIDLFDDPPFEKLGEPILTYPNRIIGILKNAETCIISNGAINGIGVNIKNTDPEYQLIQIITEMYDKYSNIFNKDYASFSMRQKDYSYMAGESSKFVSKDPTRYFMTGICFDFNRSEDSAVNIVATDGKKLCCMNKKLNNEKIKGEFIIIPECLFVPSSNFNTVQFNFSEKSCRLIIKTEGYYFESFFNTSDYDYPNYIRVIPKLSEKTEWFTLNPSSFRMAIDSVKNLMDKDDSIYLNAENIESLSITAGGATLEVEGTASRPMHVSFLWQQLSPCLFDEVSFTKFYLDGSNKAVLSNETVKGLTMDVIKIFQPTTPESFEGLDEFCIPNSSFAEAGG